MLKGFLFGAFAILIGLAGYLVWHLGVFAAVQISQEDRPEMYTLFEDHRGAYFRISETINDVEKKALEKSLDCKLSYGEFLDDPNSTDEDRLRSRGGCISEKPFANAPAGTQSGKIANGRFIVAEFSGSPAIGPWKVYSKIQKYAVEQRLKLKDGSIEIYRLIGDLKNPGISTQYLFRLETLNR